MKTTDQPDSPDTPKPCRQPRLRSTPKSASPAPQPSDDVMDVTSMASLLHIHAVTVRLKAASGEIPGRQIGNRWRFSRSKIMQWLETSA